MSKPFAIAVVGAPGSGKTEFIEAFIEKADSFFTEIDQHCTVIKGSAAHVRDMIGQAVGIDGGYHVNLMVAMHRIGQEMRLRERGDSFIVDGTLVETLAYSGLQVETLGQGVKTPENDARMLREMHTATVLANLLMDTYMYSYVVYLPLLGTDLILPGGETAEQTFHKRVDMTIRQVFQNFRMTVLELRGDTDQKVTDLLGLMEEVAGATDDEAQDRAAAAQHTEAVMVADPREIEGLG